jgi:hypothetical protein
LSTRATLEVFKALIETMRLSKFIARLSPFFSHNQSLCFSVLSLKLYLFYIPLIINPFISSHLPLSIILIVLLFFAFISFLSPFLPIDLSIYWIAYSKAQYGLLVLVGLDGVYIEHIRSVSFSICEIICLSFLPAFSLTPSHSLFLSLYIYIYLSLSILVSR